MQEYSLPCKSTPKNPPKGFQKNSLPCIKTKLGPSQAPKPTSSSPKTNLIWKRRRTLGSSLQPSTKPNYKPTLLGTSESFDEDMAKMLRQREIQGVHQGHEFVHEDPQVALVGLT